MAWGTVNVDEQTDAICGVGAAAREDDGAVVRGV